MIEDKKVKSIFFSRLDSLIHELSQLQESGAAKKVLLERVTKIKTNMLAELPEGVKVQGKTDNFIVYDQIFRRLKKPLECIVSIAEKMAPFEDLGENCIVGFAAKVSRLNNVDIPDYLKYAGDISDKKIRNIFINRIALLERGLTELKKSNADKKLFLKEITRIKDDVMKELPEGTELLEEDWYIVNEYIFSKIGHAFLMIGLQADTIKSLDELGGRIDDHLSRVHTSLNRADMESSMGRDIVEETIPLAMEIVEKLSEKGFKERCEKFYNYQSVCLKLYKYYSRSGRFNDSAQVLILLVEQEKIVLGRDHQNVVASLMNIGLSFLSFADTQLENYQLEDYQVEESQVGDYQKALLYLEESLKTSKKKDRNVRMQIDCLDKIVYTLTKMGNEEQAIKYKEEADSLREVQGGYTSMMRPGRSQANTVGNFYMELERNMRSGQDFARFFSSMQ